MQSPGFVGVENLVSEEDYSVVIMMSTWKTMEHWRAWSELRITRDLLKQAKGFVKGAARVTAYRTMPTVEWR
jgi:heme-degrading monooxygenase HmoA